MSRFEPKLQLKLKVDPFWRALMVPASTQVRKIKGGFADPNAVQ